MTRFLVLCLILAYASVILATAYETVHTMVEPNHASFTNPPNNGKIGIAEAQAKMGKQDCKPMEPIGAPCLSPSEPPLQYSTKEVSSSIEETETAQVLEIYLKKRHHSVDKSVVGGGVILGGLATTFLVAVFCYIRVTGRKNAETST